MSAPRLESGWRDVLRRRGISGRVWRLASIVHLELQVPDEQATLAMRMRSEGVDLLHTSAFVSAVHSDEDISSSIAALDRALLQPTA